MVYSLCRILSPRKSCKLIRPINVRMPTCNRITNSLKFPDIRVTVHLFNQNSIFTKPRQLDMKTHQHQEQLDYIKSVTENESEDWLSIKNEVLSKQGNINQKNFDAVMLKYMVGAKKFDSALSFAQHLKNTSDELSLGAISGILVLYSELGKENKLSKDQKQFILNTHVSLYEKYKILDSSTSERLVHALCVINEWEAALKILTDIHVTCTPTHSAYSTIIATLFRLNKKKKALELIEQSVNYKRPLQTNAYTEWINYILRKYKDKKVIAKHLDEVGVHLAKYCAVISIDTAVKLTDVYTSLDWNAEFSKIRKIDGQCSCCKNTLDCLILSKEEFNTLQMIIKDKLIVGSDLFLKTSPDELQRFLNFVDSTAPYDIVLDALNICYAIGKGFSVERLKLLDQVVDYFAKHNKKMLVLGRKHMMKWPRIPMERIKSKAQTFFTEDLSQDDPYFITAAILSGQHTDIVSKDLLRGHKFLLKDESLKNIFRRWQWQHQWMMFLNARKGIIMQPPIKFTPCAQKKNGGWHLPYESETPSESGLVNDGMPDLTSWLCLRPKA